MRRTSVTDDVIRFVLHRGASSTPTSSAMCSSMRAWACTRAGSSGRHGEPLDDPPKLSAFARSLQPD
jgi:hypothetical protein